MLGFFAHNGRPFPISYIQEMYDKYADDYVYSKEENNYILAKRNTNYWIEGWNSKSGAFDEEAEYLDIIKCAQCILYAHLLEKNNGDRMSEDFYWLRGAYEVLPMNIDECQLEVQRVEEKLKNDLPIQS